MISLPMTTVLELKYSGRYDIPSEQFTKSDTSSLLRNVRQIMVKSTIVKEEREQGGKGSRKYTALL